MIATIPRAALRHERRPVSAGIETGGESWGTDMDAAPAKRSITDLKSLNLG